MNQVPAVDVGTFSDVTIDPWSLLWAVLSVLAGWILSRVTRRAVSGLLARLTGIPEPAGHAIANAASYLVLFIGIGVALSFLGAQIQPVLATVIIIGILLALALRGIAENFSAGIVIQSRQIIRPGDEIEILDFNGVVKEVNSRSVVIGTWDGRVVHIPNSNVLTNPLVNVTEGGASRSEVEVRVLTRDVTGTRARLLAVAKQTDGVLDRPEPRVQVTAVDPERVITLVQFWHAPSDGASVASNVVTSISDAFEGGLTATTPRPVAPQTPPLVL